MQYLSALQKAAKCKMIIVIAFSREVKYFYCIIGHFPDRRFLGGMFNFIWFINKKMKNRICPLKRRLEAHYRNDKNSISFLKRHSLEKYSTQRSETDKKDFSDIGIGHQIFLKRSKVFYFLCAFFIFLKVDEFFQSLEKNYAPGRKKSDV